MALTRLSSFPALLSLSFSEGLHFIVVVFLAYCIIWLIYTRTLHPLSHIPGPFWPSVSRLWIVKHVSRGDMEHVQRALHTKYGYLVRIAPNEIACSDPEAIKKIYPTQKPLTKTDFYPIWGNKTFSKYPDNFSGTDEKLHAERRRIVNNVYSLSTVLSFETYIDSCSELFIHRMGEYADNNKIIDLGEWLQWYAFDVIGELFFGRMFGFMEKAHDHESYIKSLDTLLPVLCKAAVASKTVRILILTSSIFNSAARSALKAVDHIASAAPSCVAERRRDDTKKENGNKRGDLLHHLLDIANSKGEKVDFGIGEVEYEAYVALFAGSDTTAIALRACFYYLMKNGQVYKQVEAEIDEATARDDLSSPIRFVEASKLPLLSASIKEAMRLHPSVGLTMPRIVPVGGLQVAGQHIPAGWRIGMNAAVVGYDENIYGSDADDFRPARLLEGDTSQMDRNMLVFGTGTRTCIGKNISLSEIHKLLPLVIQHFDLQLVDQSVPWQTQDFWFNKQSGLKVKVSRRL